MSAALRPLGYTRGMDAAQTEVADLRRMVVQLSRLVEISVTLNSTLDRETLLRFIAASAADVLEAEMAVILLVDPNTRALQAVAAAGPTPPPASSADIPQEGSIAGTVLREQRPLILNEVETGQGTLGRTPELSNKTVHSLLAVPVLSRDQAVGVLEVANKRGGAFDEADARTLGIVASQAAVAIHNSRLLQGLQDANRELGRLDKLKDDFIAVASHELRTPLGVILGYAAILREEAGGETSEHAEAVLSSAQRLRALIEDMTHLNLMGAAADNLRMEPADLRAVLENACASVKDMLAASKSELEIHLPDDPLVAMVDTERVELALANLLNNAIRFNAPRAHIEAELVHRGREAWFRVRDQGIGLAADELERVFDPFYQVEDHMTRRHEGLGLGLTIVRGIAGAHRGRAWAESRGPGHGTTFTMTIPLDG
jgi:signal transduction histidine kinase